MGFFDGWDGGSVISHKSSHRKSSSSHKHRRDKSRSRSRSRHGSSKHHNHSHSGLGGLFGEDSHYDRHNSSRASFFNLGNHSSRSFFGLGRSSSYYRRSPRSNFVHKTLKKLKRLLRDLMYYAKRHPVKVFMLVIMPLVTGGALTALLARFGLRLPPGLTRMLGIAAKTASGDSIGLMGEAVRMATGGFGGGGGGASSVRVERGREGGYQWERRSGYDEGGGLMDGIRRFF
ncbi:hypothetical protein GGR56DRAFT_178843 [Xylariaceae sp. FL0804]|nr:hypothetical protein GGR56DRAFT_178843 [Xylariaceae sp. FL0804]